MCKMTKNSLKDCYVPELWGLNKIEDIKLSELLIYINIEILSEKGNNSYRT